MRKIFGVGIDEIQVSRVEEACKKASFLKKYYSEKERREIEERSSRAATDFAGKEAVVKAFGTGFTQRISPIEVQILRGEQGAPCVELTGKALQWAQKHHICAIHISLTDTREYASAFVVAEKDDDIE